jgi:hypothetical protein
MGILGWKQSLACTAAFKPPFTQALKLFPLTVCKLKSSKYSPPLWPPYVPKAAETEDLQHVVGFAAENGGHSRDRTETEKATPGRDE